MSLRKIKIPIQRIAKVFNISTTHPHEPPGTHLTDEESAGYASAVLSDADVQRVEMHLALCPECCAEVEHLLEAAETWRDLDIKETIAALQAGGIASTSVESSPEYLLSSAVSAAMREHVSAAVRALLVRWDSWLNSLPAGALGMHVWKPVSVGGFLAPIPAIESDSGINRPVEPRGPTSRTMDLVLQSPTELIFFEVPPGVPVTVRITIKRRADTSPLLVLLTQDAGRTTIADAPRDTTLPVHSAQFNDVAPGNYFIALSPGSIPNLKEDK
jgi:hypothetical protein